jgi:hypothetical protein
MNRHTRLGNRQKGMSTAGMIFAIGFFGLIVTTVMTLFPMYYGNMKLSSVLESVQQDITVDAKSKRAIWDSMKKRLYIQSVTDIKRENVTMERKDGKTTVTVTYEARDTFVGNLFIGASFTESVVIDR